MKRFTSDSLPSLIPGTDGYALPRPGMEVAACAVPEETEMTTPWGQILKGKPGSHWHVAQDAEGDHYPNDEFESYYSTDLQLEENDPRAKFLMDYWKERGHKVTVYRAQKTKPAIVVGVIAEEGIFETTEGDVPIQPGTILLESPDIKGRMWPIQPQVFLKKYDDAGIRKSLPDQPQTNI